MNSSDASHHPPPRPPIARPPTTPDTHPEPPNRPSQPPSRPLPLNQAAQPPQHHQSRSQHSAHLTAQAGGGLFSSLRGGAGSFLKNLKDTTGKVMQTVQQ